MYFRFSLETDASPEQAFRAFTDFSDRRLRLLGPVAFPRLWKAALDRTVDTPS